jgi:type I restriction enzyme R subunit
MCWACRPRTRTAKRDGKRRFADAALAMGQAFSLCCTLDEAKALREEVAFLQAVKVILTKRDITAQKRTDEAARRGHPPDHQPGGGERARGGHLRRRGLDKPNIGLLDDEFLAQVKNLPERNLAVELLERLLEGEIKAKFATNVVQQRKFSDLLAA